MRKLLLTIAGDMIAPRFDLATEVLVAACEDGRLAAPPRSMLLPGPSADELCGLILKEGVSVLVCGGIEEEHWQFLVWKKVKVVDKVIGMTQDVLQRALDGDLRAGEIVRTVVVIRGEGRR